MPWDILAMTGANSGATGSPVGSIREGTYLALRSATLTAGLSATETRGGQMLGSPAYAPVLRTSDGLDALPAWQKQAVLFSGGRL